MNDCKILSRFECCGKNMVTVRFNNGTHVMTVEDLKRIRKDILLGQKKKRWKMNHVA